MDLLGLLAAAAGAELGQAAPLLAELGEQRLRRLRQERHQHQGDDAQALDQVVEDFVETGGVGLVLGEDPRRGLLDITVEATDEHPDDLQGLGQLGTIEQVAQAVERAFEVLGEHRVDLGPLGDDAVAVARHHRQRAAGEVAVVVGELGLIPRLETGGGDRAVLAEAHLAEEVEALMHCMAGLDSATSGAVYIGDIQLNALDDRRLTRLRRDRIGFVFQAYNLVPTLTALENITLPSDIAGHPIDPAWLSTVVDTLGLRDRLKHRPNELSGGQQQRVACARALAGRPAIVFADEPTGNLDSRTGAEVLSFLRESVRRTGQTIAMVTHDPSAAAYADRVLFLADGRIVDEMQDPTSERVLERMKAFEADVPHPEVVWAETSYDLPPAPMPTQTTTPPIYAPPLPPPPPVAPPPVAPPPVAAPIPPAPVPGSVARRTPVQPPVPEPAVTPSSNGPAAPDAIDMANWTDADWDAWLARKQTETGSGA